MASSTTSDFETTQHPAEAALPGVHNGSSGEQDAIATARVARIYNAYRTCRLNAKYYGYRLAAIQFRNQIIEGASAVGMSASFAALSIWHTTYGQLVFCILFGCSTILTIVRPTLNYARRIEHYSKLWAAYTSVVAQLRGIVDDMQIKHIIHSDIHEILEQMDKLCGDDDPLPNRGKLSYFKTEVEQEIPADTLWWPSAKNDSLPADG